MRTIWAVRNLKLFNIMAYALMVGVNWLANSLPINGISTGQVSDAYPNLFAPAGITFAIWGLIYLLLAGFVVFQLSHFSPHTRTGSFARISRWFIGSCLANAAWIFSWHYRFIPLSMILMLLLFYSLIRIYRILLPLRLTGKERLFIRLPFSIYLAWITVAAIANATVLLVSLGWSGQGISQESLAVLGIGTGAAAGLAVTLIQKDLAFGLVIVWAFGGILIKHLSAGGFAGRYPDIILTASLSCGLMLIALFKVAATGVRRKRSVPAR